MDIMSGVPRKANNNLNLIYMFVTRHEVHNINTHTLQNAERFTRHWNWWNHRVTDIFCNCIEGRTTGLQIHS